MQGSYQTKRLFLRTPMKADAAQIAVLANDYEICSQTASLPYPLDLEKATQWLVDTQDDIHFIITCESQPVGSIRAKPSSSKSSFKEVQLSYWLAKSYWGQGYMTEAVIFMIDHLFAQHGFDVIKADHAQDNPASGKVLEKVGFQLCGPIVCYSKARDMDVPCWEYRLDKSQYRK